MSESELAAIEAEERALEEEEHGVAPYDEDEMTINDIRNKSQSGVRSGVYGSRRRRAEEEEVEQPDYQEMARQKGEELMKQKDELMNKGAGLLTAGMNFFGVSESPEKSEKKSEKAPSERE